MDKAGAGRGAEIRESVILEGTERRNSGDGGRIYTKFHIHLLVAHFPPPHWVLGCLDLVCLPFQCIYQAILSCPGLWSR